MVVTLTLTLHYSIILHHITLHFITLHYVTFYYIRLHHYATVFTLGWSLQEGLTLHISQSKWAKAVFSDLTVIVMDGAV